MKPLQTLAGIGAIAALLVFSAALLTIPALGQAPSSATAAQGAYQLLTNPGMEIYDPPYAQFHGVDCQVATGWQRFWYDSPEPCFMDNRVFAKSHLGTGWVDRIEGATSQLIVATEPYSAGLQQQVTGLTPGAGYGFHAAMLTIFQSSAPPDNDGTMIKQVGMDPTGGTDPQAATVVWSPPNDNDEGPWDIDQRTAVYASSPTMTVFIRVLSPYPAGNLPYVNLSFLDSAILAQTPTVHAVSPAVTESPTFTVNWDNAVKAPVDGQLKWRDVQWLDEAEGVWHDWLIKTYEVEADFVGQMGHTYRFRARAWQRYPNGAHLYGPYSADGDTSTHVLGPQLVGSVLSPEGNPVSGATVAISGTALATLSGPDGSYLLNVPVLSETQTVTVGHPTWLAPGPVYGLSIGPTETVTLTWALISPDNAVFNGEFETDLETWSLIAGQGVTPTIVTEPVHTGLGALALGGASPVSSSVSYTVGVTQRVVMTNAWEPVLSFWYRPLSTDTEDVFNVILTVVTQSATATLPLSLTSSIVAPLSSPTTSTVPITTTLVFTPAMDSADWQHASYHAGPPNDYLTGTVTLRFQVWNDGDDATTTVYLDEVSLGATQGGPYKAYLPLLLKGR